MSFFRSLKNILATGSRHPSEDGVPDEREGKRSVDDDNVDSIASAASLFTTPTSGGVAPMAPPNWVPSQQNDKPRH
jgi:hypothetical protein